MYHKVLLLLHGPLSYVLYVGSFSKSRHCTSCHMDPNCTHVTWTQTYEVYYCIDTKFLAEIYTIALNLTDWM